VVLTIFRSRLRPGVEAEYSAWAERLEALAERMPGFVSIKTFRADDGERVSLVVFESEQTSQAWRRHPEHLRAQQLGRERFYAEYSVQVATPTRSYGSRSAR
jgi:heme-degrading monooxygenase HmoA